MNVVIIAHGGKLIGMGHIMRTLTLADELKSLKVNVSFISKYEQGINLIRDKGYEVLPVDNSEQQLLSGFNYGSEEELQYDILLFEKMLHHTKPDVIIIDSYNVSLSLFHTLRRYSRCLVYIDDLNKFSYPVNILINGTICAEKMNYKKGLENELMLLGLKFNLIRSEFKNLPIRSITQYVKNIMITVGGSDPYNITQKLIEFVSQEEEFDNRIFHIVVTSSFSYKSEILGLSDKYKNIMVYENPKRMSDIMMQSDLAISAGGSTVYEFATCGVPLMVFCYADNQRPQIELMEEMGLITYLGMYDELEYHKFAPKYETIIQNYENRYQASHHGQKLIDCRGSERIAMSIINYCNGIN